MINSIFAIPVYLENDTSIASIKDKETLNKIISGEVRNTSSSDPKGNSSTVNTFVLEDDDLRSIKRQILNHLKKYVETVICPKDDISLYITQSWMTVTEPGQSHHYHMHENSLISGVYYPKSAKNDRIYFDTGFYAPTLLSPLFQLECSEYNIWNSTEHWLPIKTNDIIIFPSWLKHAVRVNLDQTTKRIALGFNTFMEGNIGRPENLTQLKLKSVENE